MILDNACMSLLLPFFVNRAIIAVLLEIIASANDLTDYSEKPNGCGSRFLHRSYRMLSRWFVSEVNTLQRERSRGQVSPNAAYSNGVEDANEVLTPLVVHPVRIVIPVEPKKPAVNKTLDFWNYKQVVLRQKAIRHVPTRVGTCLIAHL